jgi:AraC-like DNA-binding protein
MSGYFDDIRFANVARNRECTLPMAPFRNDAQVSLELLRQGRLRFIVNGRQQVIEAPVVFWNVPRKTYQYEIFTGETHDHSWTDFTGPRAARIGHALDRISPRCYLPIRKPLEFGQIFDEMVSVYRQNDLLSTFRIVVGVERLLGLLYEELLIPERTDLTRSSFIVLAREISGKPFGEWDFPTRAAEMHMSYTNFRRLFRKVTGSSPHEYLLTCRMRWASRELLRRDVQVKQIADECGFDDVSSFSRLFKKKLGVPPSHYAGLPRMRSAESA